MGGLFLDFQNGGLIKSLKPGDKVVIHVTRHAQDPVMMVPFIFNIMPQPDGTLGFAQIPNIKQGTWDRSRYQL
ncbi:MAG: hypothetical protein NT010_05640 [Proteobacteria bacterium]|nr:hypothetical protein [Pseudomonadota bacterium]